MSGTAIKDKFQTAVIISGLITFIARTTDAHLQFMGASGDPVSQIFEIMKQYGCLEFSTIAVQDISATASTAVRPVTSLRSQHFG